MHLIPKNSGFCFQTRGTFIKFQANLQEEGKLIKNKPKTHTLKFFIKLVENRAIPFVLIHSPQKQKNAQHVTYSWFKSDQYQAFTALIKHYLQALQTTLPVCGICNKLSSLKKQLNISTKSFLERFCLNIIMFFRIIQLLPPLSYLWSCLIFNFHF